MTVLLTRRKARSHPAATLAVLVAGLFGFQALESMLGPALPLIQHALGTSTAAIAWVLTGVLLAGAVATPLIGRLADIRDKRRVLIVLLSVVAVGTLISGLASSVPVLVVGQLLQGTGLGIVPLAIGMIRDTQPPQRGKVGNGLIVGTAGLASMAGLVLAGPIAAALSYQWLFWLPFILLLVTLFGAWWFVPSCPPAARSGRIDLIGAALLGTGLAVLLVGLTLAPVSGWVSAGFLVPLVVSLALLAVFVVVELRATTPLVEIRLMRSRPVWLICVVSFVVGFATFTLALLAPKLVELPPSTGYGLGATVTVAGLVLLPMGVAAAVTGPLTGRLERLLGPRGVMVLATVALAAASLMLFVGQALWTVAVAALLSGIGQGVGLTGVMNIVVATVPAERTGAVTGISFVLRAVGGTFGAQVGAGILAADVIPGTMAPTWGAVSTTLWVSAAAGVAAAVLCLGFRARTYPSPRAERVDGKVAQL